MTVYSNHPAARNRVRPVIWRRLRHRRLLVGRWPYRREIVVTTIRSVVLGAS